VSKRAAVPSPMPKYAKKFGRTSLTSNGRFKMLNMLPSCRFVFYTLGGTP
jgi:hypothetical protein